MKQYSSKKSVQLLAHILESYGIEHYIISPGSRNAPMSIHFSEIDQFNCYSIVDERSAAFVALGMAKSLKKPVGLICTSGSAVANYYPAVTEAFYQNVPLLLLTADRPKDKIDQFEGQTIRQYEFFSQHSCGDFELLEDFEVNAEEYNYNSIKKAIELAFEKQGPVHINIPLSEPLYDLTAELPVMPSVENTIKKTEYTLSSHLVAEWHTAKRRMILVGTKAPNEKLQMELSQLVKNHSAVVLTEANSNLTDSKFFEHIDRYIFNLDDDQIKGYAPDLLITVGQNVVSKKIKQFLHKARPQLHWHVDEHWHPDTFHVLTDALTAKPEDFFTQLIEKIDLSPSPYFNLWENLKMKKDAKHDDYVNRLPFSDFSSFHTISQYIPENYNVHISNSSSIRYAELLDYNKFKVYCNRGTSGIEGSTSTAMGFAMVDPNPTLLITGDLSFFYDLNGLWNTYIPPYTRIIIMNNGGGDIFNIIPGPSKAENALHEFIATNHHKKAEYLAHHFGFEYITLDDESSLGRVLMHFFKPTTKPVILEINTQKVDNADILKSYFKFLDQ